MKGNATGRKGAGKKQQTSTVPTPQETTVIEDQGGSRHLLSDSARERASTGASSTQNSSAISECTSDAIACATRFPFRETKRNLHSSKWVAFTFESQQQGKGHGEQQ